MCAVKSVRWLQWQLPPGNASIAGEDLSIANQSSLRRRKGRGWGCYSIRNQATWVSRYSFPHLPRHAVLGHPESRMSWLRDVIPAQPQVRPRTRVMSSCRYTGPHDPQPKARAGGSSGARDDIIGDAPSATCLSHSLVRLWAAGAGCHRCAILMGLPAPCWAERIICLWACIIGGAWRLAAGLGRALGS